VTYAGISGKDYCSIGLGPKFIAAYPKHLENGKFSQVTVSLRPAIFHQGFIESMGRFFP
jgi:hypothetical protein